ncbi:MAG: sulfatase-like hydrolase/transferase [Acidobacteriia bacterium]|nr:sulfatase-like hydrolase/transferase [Terriglobia bacterium]
MPSMLRGNRRTGTALAALALSGAALFACGPGEAPTAPASSESPARLRFASRRPDVVLITVDTLRFDATGFSGAGRVKTPTFDRLASEGRAFPSAHAHAVITLPSHASILTGLYPYQHGIRDNAGFVLRDDVPTLATVLKGEGYATGAFVSSFTLDGRFGLKRGFDFYDDRCEGYSGDPSRLAERPGDVTVGLALAWWEAHRDAPRFLWVHVFTPHYPYDPPEPFKSRYSKAPYFGDVALADEQIRPVVEALERSRDLAPIVVFTGDHGESLGEHGEKSHGIFCYESTLRIPLVLWSPGRIPPGSDPRPARHVDILPTVLGALGLSAPAGVPGRSLLGPAGDDASSYFEALTAWLNRGWAPLYGRIEGGRKAIDLPVAELYDLPADPGETKNLARTSPAIEREIASRIPAEAREAPGRETPDRETVEKLRSLGYLAAGPAPAPVRFDASSDPKNLIFLDEEVNKAVLRYRKGHDAPGAIRDLESILARAPGMANVYMQLAVIEAEQGRVDQALSLLRKAVSTGTGGEKMKIQLARGLSQAGRADEAWAALSDCLDSRNPETQEALGTVAAAQGRYDEAQARFDKALALDPTYPAARVDLAVLLMNRGRADEARKMLERALSENAYLPDGWNAMGVIRAQEGDVKGAVDAWERALRINPKLTIALVNLAVAAEKLGDRGKAVAALRKLVPMLQGSARSKAEAKLRALEQGAPSGR